MEHFCSNIRKMSYISVLFTPSSKNKKIYKRYIHNTNITELSCISEKIYAQSWYFQKLGICRT